MSVKIRQGVKHWICVTVGYESVYSSSRAVIVMRQSVLQYSVCLWFLSSFFPLCLFLCSSLKASYWDVSCCLLSGSVISARFIYILFSFCSSRTVSQRHRGQSLWSLQLFSEGLFGLENMSFSCPSTNKTVKITTNQEETRPEEEVKKEICILDYNS